MAICYLILGSNSTNKNDNLLRAIAFIKKEVGTIIQSSSVYETEPWGYISENSYVNQVLCVKTILSPLELLHTTQNIEKKLGRTTKSRDGIYTDRPIDIDILFYNNERIDLPELIIPHPHISQRRFVLEPLQEIALHFKHPVLDKTISEISEICQDNLRVKRL